MGERPTLEDLREKARNYRERSMEEEVALRWAKDQILCWAAGHLVEHDAKLPEDAREDAKAWSTLLKVALRELWDTYDFPPDFSYPRPFAEFEPPDDFDFGAVMERRHERALDEYREDRDLPEPGADTP